MSRQVIKGFCANTVKSWPQIRSLLGEIEDVITNDIGNRGIRNLVVRGDFHEACRTLVDESNRVGILLGFPLFNDQKPFEENDGIAGAIYIARALLHLEKEVTFFIDSHSDVLKNLLKEYFLHKTVEVEHIPKGFTGDNTHILLNSITGSPKFSHLISIERTCQNTYRRNMTMTARDISENCDPIDLFFQQAEAHSGVTTIGIGDGGNEVGMGKVYDRAVKHIPNGSDIAASVSCQYLITCGVSNWGGVALAAGLFIMSCAKLKKEPSIDDFLLTDIKDEELNRRVSQLGFRDGINGQPGMTVDNLDYYQIHRPLLQQVREIALKMLLTEKNKVLSR